MDSPVNDIFRRFKRLWCFLNLLDDRTVETSLTDKPSFPSGCIEAEPVIESVLLAHSPT